MATRRPPECPPERLLRWHTLGPAGGELASEPGQELLIVGGVGRPVRRVARVRAFGQRGGLSTHLGEHPSLLHVSALRRHHPQQINGVRRRGARKRCENTVGVRHLAAEEVCE